MVIILSVQSEPRLCNTTHLPLPVQQPSVFYTDLQAGLARGCLETWGGRWFSDLYHVQHLYLDAVPNDHSCMSEWDIPGRACRHACIGRTPDVAGHGVGTGRLGKTAGAPCQHYASQLSKFML